MSADFKTAFITEADRLVSVNLQTQQVTELVGYLVNPWYMDWAADDQSAIYLVDKEPGNRLHRVDLTTTPASLQAIVPLPAGPWSVVRSANPDILYVGEQDRALEDLALGRRGRADHHPPRLHPLHGDRPRHRPGHHRPVVFLLREERLVRRLHPRDAELPGHARLRRRVLQGVRGRRPDIATWTNYKWVAQHLRPAERRAVLRLLQDPGPGDIWAIPDLGFVLDSTKYTEREPQAARRALRPLPGPARPGGQRGAAGGQQPAGDGHPDRRARRPAAQRVRADHQRLRGHHGHLQGLGRRGHLYNYGLADNWGSAKSAPITSDQYIGVHDASPRGPA